MYVAMLKSDFQTLTAKIGTSAHRHRPRAIHAATPTGVHARAKSVIDCDDGFLGF
jgi:hypothetical protein